MLDISKLENARHRGSRIIAACPACRAAGRDRQGNHLIIYVGDSSSCENAAFGCVANEADGSHRSEIFSLVGIKDAREKPSANARRERIWQTEQKLNQRNMLKQQQQRITAVIQGSLESCLAPYVSKSWKIELLDSSPINFDCPNAVPHDFILSLYKPVDILWMGDILDSGHRKHQCHFRSRDEWLKQNILPPRIAPATFRPDSYSRSSINVKSSPFIIIECDDLIGYKPTSNEDKNRNKQLSHALIGYAQEELGLKLRAVIDTGNKSLHAWFDRPPPRALDAIKKMATGLRIDVNAIDQGHAPFRMPGCIHDKTNQVARLLYLNPIKS